MRDDTALWHLHRDRCCSRLSRPVCHGSLPDPTCAVCTRADPSVSRHLVYNLLPPRAMVAHCDLDLVHHSKLNRAAKVPLLETVCGGTADLLSNWGVLVITAAGGIASPSMTVLMILSLSTQFLVLLSASCTWSAVVSTSKTGSLQSCLSHGVAVSPPVGCYGKSLNTGDVPGHLRNTLQLPLLHDTVVRCPHPSPAATKLGHMLGWAAAGTGVYWGPTFTGLTSNSILADFRFCSTPICLLSWPKLHPGHMLTLHLYLNSSAGYLSWEGFPNPGLSYGDVQTRQCLLGLPYVLLPNHHVLQPWRSPVFLFITTFGLS